MHGPHLLVIISYTTHYYSYPIMICDKGGQWQDWSKEVDEFTGLPKEIEWKLLEYLISNLNI